MPRLVRWWETLGRAERIVALSIGLSAPILIVDSAVWAVAACYMVHERSRVAIEQVRAQARSSAPDALAAIPTTAAAGARIARGRIED